MHLIWLESDGWHFLMHILKGNYFFKLKLALPIQGKQVVEAIIQVI